MLAGSAARGEALSPAWTMAVSARLHAPFTLPVVRIAVPLVIVRPPFRIVAAVHHLLDAIPVGPCRSRPVELAILGQVPLVKGLHIALMVGRRPVALGLERRPHFADGPFLLAGGRWRFGRMVGPAGHRLEDAFQPARLRWRWLGGWFPRSRLLDRAGLPLVDVALAGGGAGVVLPRQVGAFTLLPVGLGGPALPFPGLALAGLPLARAVDLGEWLVRGRGPVDASVLQAAIS